MSRTGLGREIIERRTFGYADSSGKNRSNCRIGHRTGEGDLNTELLTAWIKRFKYVT